METELVKTRKSYFSHAKKNEDKIKSLLEEKASLEHISEKFNVSIFSIKEIASKYELPTYTKQKLEIFEKNKQIMELVKSKVPVSEISEKFNMTRQRIQQIYSSNGVSKRDDKFNEFQKIIKDILLDIDNDFSFEEIVGKYNLTQKKITTLKRFGMPSLNKIFIKKRDKIILDLFNSGLPASEVIKTDSKFLKGAFAFTVLDSVYNLAIKNNSKRYPKISHRNSGGCFEDKKVIDLIFTKRAEGAYFSEISDFLNDNGYKTISGKKFTQQLVSYKYHFVNKQK